MTVDQVINLLVTVTLIQMMVCIGLGVTLQQILEVARDWPQVTRAAAANYLCVPAATIGLLFLFDSPPMVAAGFLVIAVCPGAPYGPPFTILAKGNVALSIGLMVILAGSSAVFAPLFLQALLPFAAESEPLNIDAAKLFATLFLTQLFPLFGGLALRHWRTAFALRMMNPMARISLILNLLVLSSILSVQFATLREILPISYLGMFALFSMTLLAGAVLGGPGRENRTSMAITTSVRNAAVGLVIVTGSFPGTPAVTAVLAYGLFQTVLMALISLGWGRCGAKTPSPNSC